MFKKLYAVLLLTGIVNTAEAQFGTPEEQALSAQSVKLATEGKKNEAFAAMYAIKDLNIRISAMITVVNKLFNNGHKEEMIKFGALQLDSLEVLPTQKEYKYTYSNFANPYARLIIGERMYNKAAPILKKVMNTAGPMHYTVPEMYAKSLAGMGRYSEALDMVKQMIILGKATPYTRDTLFREAYAGLKGSAKGFDKLKDATIQAWKLAVRDSARHDLINRTAPPFELKDANGKVVSLAGLKGKTVVLDFWANWCQPCKASFPMMKTVQDKFRKNPDIVFLFIHCFEREANPVPEAVAYMKEHQFDFNVLFDPKDGATKESPVAKSYGIKGIPTKCVIDPAGNIRFVSVGGAKYTETEEMAIEHLVAMVEIAAKS